MGSNRRGHGRALLSEKSLRDRVERDQLDMIVARPHIAKHFLKGRELPITLPDVLLATWNRQPSLNYLLALS